MLGALIGVVLNGSLVPFELNQTMNELNLKDAIHVGHSTGGGEVARYIGRHGTELVSKAVLIGAVPPLISDIDLSLDDRFLYVACWGTGELKQYDVTDPMQPKQSGSVRIGGIAKHAPHANGTGVRDKYVVRIIHS